MPLTRNQKLSGYRGMMYEAIEANLPNGAEVMRRRILEILKEIQYESTEQPPRTEDSEVLA
jgi:hypothetical protein